MYRIETVSLRELFDIWLEDHPERRSDVASSGACTSTSDHDCVLVRDMPVQLTDRIVEHYLNERPQPSPTLVSCNVMDDAVRLVWRTPD